MAIRTLKFRVKATITKIETVEVDDTGLSEDEVINKGEELVNEQFSVLNDGSEEGYTQESEFISEGEDE